LFKSFEFWSLGIASDFVLRILNFYFHKAELLSFELAFSSNAFKVE